ncbi:MAG: thioredoxin, partial [Pseudomonadota bacterium]
MDLNLSGTPTGAAAPGTIKDGTTATFTADVMEASRDALVLVDFWATWCQPCKQLTPVLEKVVESYGGAVKLVKIDVDKNQTLAAQLRVQSLPTVMAFVGGRPVDLLMGAVSESEVRAFIERCGVQPDGAAELAEALKAAQQALAEGQLQEAASIFASILQVDQQNTEALAGLASCYLKSGDRERAQQTLSLVPPDQMGSEAVKSVEAAIALAETFASSSDSGPAASACSAKAIAASTLLTASEPI